MGFFDRDSHSKFYGGRTQKSVFGNVTPGAFSRALALIFRWFIQLLIKRILEKVSFELHLQFVALKSCDD